MHASMGGCSRRLSPMSASADFALGTVPLIKHEWCLMDANRRGDQRCMAGLAIPVVDVRLMSDASAVPGRGQALTSPLILPHYKPNNRTQVAPPDQH
jgi:hypothetical protein